MFDKHTTVNRSTGFTSSFLNLGRELPFCKKTHSLHASKAAASALFCQFTVNLRKRLADAEKSVRESLDMARQEQAAQYDMGRHDKRFNVGELVPRRTHYLSNAIRRFAASLADKWQGPYRISAKVSRLAYKLVHCETGDECGPINLNDLKRFVFARRIQTLCRYQ